MQTLRKKTSPLKYKNETSRFLGEGVSFKAKLIGILEVSEARGDRMCQEALSDLKMAIRAAGEHKQRITINIAIDGLRLRDEKTGDSLYHHPVHKISFIAQDMTDSRAFGYIFGSPDTGHRFFGIKTDKAASQVVIAMRDLFQVVFALKKKEIELAKQHLDKNRYTSSPLFSDNLVSGSKNEQLHTSAQETTKSSTTDSKSSASNTENRSGGTAVADLVDLELELNSLQQGLTQMERITPSDPFGSKDDPFGDSFTSYTKPILPPPPSGRDRSSRASESSSIFSPKTPHTAASLDTTSGAADSSLFASKDFNTSKDFSFTQDFNSSREEPSSGDWFTPSAGNSIFEEPSLVPEIPKEVDKHEATKQEILSQFDVFTELDPLGTGRSKPYIDKKHFFQELKNPPKKALNDLVSESNTQPQDSNLFGTNFGQESTKPVFSSSGNVFASDPFGEDPFKEDPFAEADFSKQDPFESDFNDFKLFSKDTKTNNLSEKYQLPSYNKTDNLQPLFPSTLSKSPKSSAMEKQMSMISTSPRSIQFTKQNTFDVQFDKFEDKKYGRMSQLHENPSLDLSSESECAPEPPPRPASNIAQIKPPPLPPKKQLGDIVVKPPPRPPHTDESHYDYMDNYETGPNSIECIKTLDKSPPLPVPARKSKFESDFTSVPERPKKQFTLQSSDEDYLTPISFPQPKKEFKTVARNAGPILLPPPQKHTRKQQQAAQQHLAQVTVASFLESKPNLTTSVAADKLNCSLEGLDITLSQLTLSGLNELANKLNIPASQLSNMTLVQLTSYISNFIKNNTTNTLSETNANTDFSNFKADFAANFNINSTTIASESFDRYAVFRELLHEEIKQTKIDNEPEEIQEEKKCENALTNEYNNLNVKPINEANDKTDKYAALREIVESEMKLNEEKENLQQDQNEETETLDVEVIDQNIINNESNKETEIENETNIIKSEKTVIEEKEKEIISSPKDTIIEYSSPLDNKNDVNTITPVKSPVNKCNVKSPVPIAVTEIIQNNSHLTSGSLSDVVSGSSPEIDNTGSASEVRKKIIDATGESWAIFDQPNMAQDSNKEKQQSEEGVSPWSSDSKEFGNGSPPEWRQRVDSGSGGDHWSRRVGRREEGWWDTSAEPEVHYYPANRRSTDSYDEECYECYDRPRRQKRTWSGHSDGRGAAGGHSSSSRDVSPWEEEPRRRDSREHRDIPRPGWSRHPRQHSFERHRDRRHTDSWDEEDDYEYEEEHASRFHWPDRHAAREAERERHSSGSRDLDGDRWPEDWNDDRRHRRRREMDRERWCCPDWNQAEQDKSRHYGGRWSNVDSTSAKWRDRKHEERYYSRDSQESPWEDDYSNDPTDSHSSHYLTAKRNWKRPSSASEMDRKTGDIKSRHYLGTGGSDGERDRRYKSGRRSKSRESQFSDTTRHKIDPGLTLRNPHRNKQHTHTKVPFETEFPQEILSKKQLDNSKSEIISNKRTSNMASRKKTKESSKTEDITINTFPRKGTTRAQSLFENDFVLSETESPVTSQMNTKFTFENDFETSEAESPTINKVPKDTRQVSSRHGIFDNDFSKDCIRQRPTFKDSKHLSRYQVKQKSLFEDDFSPTEKIEQIPEDNSISSIKEEVCSNEEKDSFTTNNFGRATNSRKKIFNKNRLSNNLRGDASLKKSESVNIFARENDPFDDDFFCGKASGDVQTVDSNKEKPSPKTTELKWNEEFDDFDIDEK